MPKNKKLNCQCMENFTPFPCYVFKRIFAIIQFNTVTFEELAIFNRYLFATKSRK